MDPHWLFIGNVLSNDEDDDDDYDDNDNNVLVIQHQQ